MLLRMQDLLSLLALAVLVYCSAAKTIEEQAIDSLFGDGLGNQQPLESLVADDRRHDEREVIRQKLREWHTLGRQLQELEDLKDLYDMDEDQPPWNMAEETDKALARKRAFDILGGSHLFGKRGFDSLGGAHLFGGKRSFDSLGGAHLFGGKRAFDTLGGSHLFTKRGFDTLGGSHLFNKRGFDTLGGSHLFTKRGFDTLGGSHLFNKRGFDSLGGGHLFTKRDNDHGKMDTTEDEDVDSRYYVPQK